METLCWWKNLLLYLYLYLSGEQRLQTVSLHSQWIERPPLMALLFGCKAIWSKPLFRLAQRENLKQNLLYLTLWRYLKPWRCWVFWEWLPSSCCKFHLEEKTTTFWKTCFIENLGYRFSWWAFSSKKGTKFFHPSNPFGNKLSIPFTIQTLRISGWQIKLV